MPKTSNYKKEQIISTALDLVRKGGPEALTARSLGAAMGCSTSPLFTVCGNLEVIRKEVHKAAANEVLEYVKDALNYIPAFKEYGMRLVRFAKNEPNVFKLAFLTDNAASDTLNPIAMKCLEEMQHDYKLTEDEVNLLLQQVWTFACGLSMLMISGAADFSEEQISDMLSRQFAGSIMLIKAGIKVDNITPRLRKEGEGATIPLPIKQ